MLIISKHVIVLSCKSFVLPVDNNSFDIEYFDLLENLQVFNILLKGSKKQDKITLNVIGLIKYNSYRVLSLIGLLALLNSD